MRLSSTKSPPLNTPARCWLALVMLAALALFAAEMDAQSPPKSQSAGKRAYELSLARLRPGHDTLESASRIYGEQNPAPDRRSADTPEWFDGCTGRFLRLEVDDAGRIGSVTISALGPLWGDCPANPPDIYRTGLWRTARGLGLRDTRARVLALYGKPDSRVPSTQAGRELELMFYSFDWAGPDVPQVMEVTLERGRVVQITLAAQSL